MISKEKLIGLYTAMVKCRVIADYAMAGDFAAAVHTGFGREAIFAGVCGDLLPGDTVDCSPVDAAASYLLGAPFEKLFASYSANGNGRAMTNSSRLDRLAAVCDAAKTHKQSKDGKVAVAFCKEGDSEPTHWRNALSRASKQTLPVIYVCSHSIQTVLPPAKTAKSKNPHALAFGVPVISVDGSDVRAVYRVASESIARARQRRGPTVIECLSQGLTQRPNAKRTNGHHKAAQDCLVSMERYLVARRLLKAEAKQQIADSLSRELQAASQSMIH